MTRMIADYKLAYRMYLKSKTGQLQCAQPEPSVKAFGLTKWEAEQYRKQVEKEAKNKELRT
jgi:hypothetical protein